MFKRHFGFAPKGLLAVGRCGQQRNAAVLEEEGFNGQPVGSRCCTTVSPLLQRRRRYRRTGCISPYRPYGGGKIVRFSRDDGLSDLIGFTYADWHADDAVGNLVQHLETIADVTRMAQPGRIDYHGWRECLGILSTQRLFFP